MMELTKQDKVILLQIIANANFNGKDVEKIVELKKKLSAEEKEDK